MSNDEFDEDVKFLPTIPPMPMPPDNTDDLAAWQAHIKTIDQYLLDLNDAIQKIDGDRFAEDYKQHLVKLGIDPDADVILPKPVMEEIGRKIKVMMDRLHVFGRHLGIDHDPTPPRRVNKSKRNIQSI